MDHLFYRLHRTGNLNYQMFEIIFLILLKNLLIFTLKLYLLSL